MIYIFKYDIHGYIFVGHPVVFHQQEK